MAITYHAGRRIQGLERTGSTATEISGFTISGTSGKVSESTGTLSFTVNSSSQSTLAVKALPANADSSYVLRYKLIVTTDDIVFNVGNAGTLNYGTTNATSGFGEDPPTSSYTIYVKHALHDDKAANYSANGSSRDNDWANGISNGSGARTKYVEVINNAGSMTIRYTDSSDYTSGLVTPAWSAQSGAQSGAKGNIFFNFASQGVASGSIVGTVSDVKFYNGITSVVASAGDVKPTDVQVGSRWEETDTRKMYHYNQPAFNKTGCVGYYTLDETSGNPSNHATSANGFTTPATETIFTLQHGHDSTGTHYIKKIGSTITTITQAQIDAGYGAVEESHAMGQINTLPSDWTDMLQGASGSINGHGWWANKYSAVTPTNGSTGATQNVTSKSGLDKCFQFSGADNQEVNLGGSMVTGGLGASGYGTGGGSGDFTFSLWINTSYTGGGNSMMLHSNSTTTNVQFLLDTNVKPKIYTATATLTSSDALSANTWYHVVATRQTQVAKIYINGVEKASGTIDHYIEGSTNMVLGGDLSSSSNNFEGKIDEVSIWNRSLSATEITALYNSGTGVTLANATQSAIWEELGT
jgi:hypothetical protein